MGSHHLHHVSHNHKVLPTLFANLQKPRLKELFIHKHGVRSQFFVFTLFFSFSFSLWHCQFWFFSCHLQTPFGNMRMQAAQFCGCFLLLHHNWGRFPSVSKSNQASWRAALSLLLMVSLRASPATPQAAFGIFLGAKRSLVLLQDTPPGRKWRLSVASRLVLF